MSGLGRRTHYRKHLTDKVLHDYPEPSCNERIAKVVSTRGSNQFDILLAQKQNHHDEAAQQQEHDNISSTPSSLAGTEKMVQRSPQLAILPTKFRKLVWVKRNDFVIVQTVQKQQDDHDDNADDDEKKDNDDEEDTASADHHDVVDTDFIQGSNQASNIASDGIVYDTPDYGFVVDDDNESITDGEYETDDDNDDNHDLHKDNNDGLFVNTNRLSTLAVQDSDSDDSDDIAHG